MKLKFFFLSFFLSLFLNISLSLVRGFAGFTYGSLVGYVLFFLLTVFCLNKFKSNIAVWQILAGLFLGLCVIQVPLRVPNFSDSLISLPEFILHLLGIVFGFLYLYFKRPANIIISIVGFIIAVFMFFQGYSLWINKLNFGNYMENVSYALPANFEVSDENKKIIVKNDFGNKIVLLDFWFTQCGACFQKFPKLQELYDKYKTDSSILILAVNKPIAEDKPKQAFEVIRQEGFSFPVVIAADDVPEAIGVAYYPTTFVIDRTGNVVFKGSIEGAAQKIEQLKENN